MYSILEQHKSNYETIQEWNRYASEHKLPDHEVFERNLGLSNLEEIVGHALTIRKETLKTYMLKYFPSKPPTIKEWTEIANTYKLPVANTFILHFGSWSKMKAEIYSK